MALLLSHWHTAEQNPRMGLWMQPVGKSPNLGNDLGVFDPILAVRIHSIPGVRSRGNTGMVSSLTQLGDSTCLLPGRICAATRHHCRELNTPWTAANSSLQIPGMGAKPPSPQLFRRVQHSRKLPQRSSAEMPRPSEHTEQDTMAGWPNSCCAELKHHAVLPTPLRNPCSFLQPVAQNIDKLTVKIIFKL